MGEPGAAAERIWASIGLERFSHPIHLKGPVVVEGRAGVLVDGSATPFASVHPEMLSLLKVSAQPNFLLTIENYASFNRQVREIESDGLIVYLGGFLWVSFPRSRHVRPGRSPPCRSHSFRPPDFAGGPGKTLLIAEPLRLLL
jgi:hypothetical protein